MTTCRVYIKSKSGKVAPDLRETKTTCDIEGENMIKKEIGGYSFEVDSEAIDCYNSNKGWRVTIKGYAPCGDLVLDGVWDGKEWCYYPCSAVYVEADYLKVDPDCAEFDKFMGSEEVRAFIDNEFWVAKCPNCGEKRKYEVNGWCEECRAEITPVLELARAEYAKRGLTISDEAIEEAIQDRIKNEWEEPKSIAEFILEMSGTVLDKYDIASIRKYLAADKMIPEHDMSYAELLEALEKVQGGDMAHVGSPEYNYTCKVYDAACEALGWDASGVPSNMDYEEGIWAEYCTEEEAKEISSAEDPYAEWVNHCESECSQLVSKAEKAVCKMIEENNYPAE